METLQEIKTAVEDLEPQVERLKALYQQYFMGIEKLPPQVLRKNVDRVIWQLRRIRFPNTALRFKFQQIIQRYNTYQQYWSRVLRDIEKGTYRRDMLRAARRFGAEELLTAAGRRAAITLRRDAPELLDEPTHELPDIAEVAQLDDDWDDDRATPPSNRFDVPSELAQATLGAGWDEESADDLPSELLGAVIDVPLEARSPPPAPAVAKPTAAAASHDEEPPSELRHATLGGLPPGTAPAPPEDRPSGAGARRGGALLGVRAQRSANVAPAAAPRAPAPPAAKLEPQPRTKLEPQPRPKLGPPPAAKLGPPPRPKLGPPPKPREGAPLAAAKSAPKPATPPAESPGPAAEAATPPEKAPSPPDRTRQIYDQYVSARKAAGESVAGITVDTLARTLETQAERLRRQHGERKSVDFEVVTANGKTMIRPVIK